MVWRDYSQVKINVVLTEVLALSHLPETFQPEFWARSKHPSFCADQVLTYRLIYDKSQVVFWISQF